MRNPRGATLPGNIRQPEKSPRGFSLRLIVRIRWNGAGKTARHTARLGQDRLGAELNRNLLSRRTKEGRATWLVSPEKVDTLLPERSQTRRRRNVVVQRIVMVAIPG
jgi:hypothetical protein